MKYFRSLAYGLFLAIAPLTSSAAPSTELNLAYDDAFVQYVAHRLAAQTLDSLYSKDLEPEHRAQFLFDLFVIYHHKLVSCDGPLKEVADTFKYSTWTAKHEPRYRDVLLDLGIRESDYWPLIQKWENGVRADVVQSFTSAKYSMDLPPCLIAGYRQPKPASTRRK